MKDKKKLILQRIKEIYSRYQKEMGKEIRTAYYMDDLEVDRYVLKVLVDIYTYDDKKDEDHRYIYQEWDLVDFIITNVLEGK